MPVSKQRKTHVDSGFAFINVAHPDEFRQKSTQRTIRSGAMASIGRSRRKQPEKPVVVELDMLLACQRIPPALPHLGIFAIEPDKRARELFHFMSGEATHVYRPFRAEWFRMALVDPSSYYLCLANAALFIDQHVTRRTSLEYTDSVESTKYYSKCLTQVTTQLACQTQSIGEGVIITVLGFVCHSFATGKWDRCEMHMQGLERIIRVRGGFHGLGNFLPLFASWFDITNSAMQDIPPRFSYQMRMGDGPSKSELPSDFIFLLERLDSTAVDLAYLREGLREMAHLANHVNRHAYQPQFWNAGVKSTLLVGPAAHCILSIPRLGILGYLNDDISYSTLLLHEAVRLGLLILLANLKKGFSLVAGELSLFLGRLSTLTFLMANISLFPELRLWAYIVDACAREGPIPQLQMSEIRRAMGDLQIQKGADAITVAKRIIWIHYMFDGEIDRVKDQIDQHETTPNPPTKTGGTLLNVINRGTQGQNVCKDIRH